MSNATTPARASSSGHRHVRDARQICSHCGTTPPPDCDRGQSPTSYKRPTSPAGSGEQFGPLGTLLPGGALGGSFALATDIPSTTLSTRNGTEVSALLGGHPEIQGSTLHGNVPRGPGIGLSARATLVTVVPPRSMAHHRSLRFAQAMPRRLSDERAQLIELRLDNHLPGGIDQAPFAVP